MDSVSENASRLLEILENYNDVIKDGDYLEICDIMYKLSLIERNRKDKDISRNRESISCQSYSITPTPLVPVFDVHTGSMRMRIDRDTGVYKECPRCGTMTERIEGCVNVMCQCGHNFNFITGVNNGKRFLPRNLINPLTGCAIAENGPTHKKLLRQGITPLQRK